MSVTRWKLGWKRCDCVKCEAALTIEQTEEDCGWVRWGDHKEEIATLKAEVDALKLGSLLTAVDVLQFIKLKEENERLRKAIQKFQAVAPNASNPCGCGFWTCETKDLLELNDALEGKQP